MPFLFIRLTSRKRGANGKPIGDYPHIGVAEVTQWKETLSAINEGRRVTSMQFLSFLRIHRVTAELCTCATYSTLGICDNILLWLLVKEPSFTVPSRYSWKYVGVRPFRYGRVRRIVASRVEPPHELRELKLQANPSKKGGKQKAKRVVEHNSSSDRSCDGEPPSLAEEVKRELARGNYTVHLLRAVNAIGPYICGVSTAMGTFTAWLEWSA